jgi:DNA-directed RNA polymerase specialized sigma24 family protein
MKKSDTKSQKPPKLKKKRGSRKSTNTYVNQKEFLEELRVYYKSDVISEQLAIYIKKIAEGLSYAPNFINYTYKEEMVGDAILKMVQALEHKKFDLEHRDNPFGYFTTIAFHAFINRIKKEKRQREAINDYQEQVYQEMLNDGAEGGNAQVYVSDHTDDDE